MGFPSKRFMGGNMESGRFAKTGITWHAVVIPAGNETGRAEEHDKEERGTAGSGRRVKRA